MNNKGVQVIDRALDILELLSVEKNGLGVTEIANRLELNKSTVHRILSAMAERGYFEKVKGRGEYKIGLKLVEISSVYLNNVELKTEAKPYLQQLTSRLNMTVHLGILDGSEAVYIEKVDVVNNIRLYSQIGKRIPIHCTSLGKSLMTGLSDIEIERRLKDYEYKRYTDNTITEREELIRQIREARQKGWAMDNQEHEPGVKCIGSMIYDYRGSVIAALSVTGSLATISEDMEVPFSKHLITAFL